MPTGYTATLVEKGQSFPDFILLCARAFGPCIDMREDSLDKPIPTSFKPSSHHKAAIAQAKSALTRLHKSTVAQRKAAWAKGRKQRMAEYQRSKKHQEEENARIDTMIAAVKAWVPPTPDHQGLKDFMLQQLDTSRHTGTYYDRCIAEMEGETFVDHHRAEVLSAQKDIEYHSKKWDEEVERAAFNTRWVKALRESLT